MWVNPELNASDAFVAAFLPGGEGGGVADLLFRKPDGAVNHDFRGKLSYSWPKFADQTPLNRGDAGYDPLFPYGFGLTYADAGDLPRLGEDRPAGAGLPDGVFFARGALPPGWSWAFEGDPAARVRSVDRRAQEDARQLVWKGSGEASAILRAVPPIDISREATGELSLVVEYRVDEAPSEPVSLWMACGDHCGGTVPVAGPLRASPLGEWRTMTVPLRCFVRSGLDPKQVRTPFAMTTSGRLALAISDVRIASAAVDQDACGAE
jgi:beta-glucosidase